MELLDNIDPNNSELEKRAFFACLVMHSDIRTATEEGGTLWDFLSDDMIKDDAREAFHYAERVLQEREKTMLHTPPKVIFLDVDGVLNSRLHWNECDIIQVPTMPQNKGSRLNPLYVARLRTILEVTGAKLVISSAWRDTLMEPLTAYLSDHGIPEREVIGRTPMLGWKKVSEIHAWLTAHPEVKQWIAIDDARLFHDSESRQVLTTWDSGLQPAHVVRAIDLLS
jgi:hypothetical protein